MVKKPEENPYQDMGASTNLWRTHPSNDCRMWRAKIFILRPQTNGDCSVQGNEVEEMVEKQEVHFIAWKEQLEREQKNECPKKLVARGAKDLKNRREMYCNKNIYYQKQKRLKTNLRPKLKIRQLRRKNILKKQPHLQSNVIIFPWDC
ncbi:uncharacterized protein [Euphorbia lathyris]|uniref:uncharacterized protein n=1 Tax=Euphorbia lathyris TaxID=212925 RepID=UPI0033132A27